MRFTICQQSRIGQRPSNQDRLAHCYSREALLMLVADGMGGHPHGELAAHLAVRHLTQAFRREARPRLPDPGRFLARALTGAHHGILDDAHVRQLPEAPHTTLVACVVQDGAAHWAHAGDSRLYLVRRGQVLARTRDHSRTQWLVEQGRLAPDEAVAHPGRNRLYSCLGAARAPQVAHSPRTPLHDGDLLVLCSDGVWAAAGDDRLVTQLSATPLRQGVAQLLDDAERRAGHHADNLSLLAMRWHGEDCVRPANAESISTHTLAVDDFTTQPDGFSMRTDPANDLNADTIERAIRKFNPTR